MCYVLGFDQRIVLQALVASVSNQYRLALSHCHSAHTGSGEPLTTPRVFDLDLKDTKQHASKNEKPRANRAMPPVKGRNPLGELVGN